MAVVLEIETSEPFDCRGWEQVSCDKAQIDRQIDEMHDLGVRSSLLLNKFDNPLAGVRFDSGAASYLINAGNRQSAGHVLERADVHRRRCTTTRSSPASRRPARATDSLLTGSASRAGRAPAYPPAPHCNTRGLTELGKHAIKRMMELGWIVNPDHMSQAAVDDTLTLLEAERYSGVISPHGWVDPGNWPRLWKLGGMAFPGHSGTDNYVEEWKKYRPRQTPYAFGWGYGADLGGLSHQPDKSAEGAITYPFKSYDGKVTFDRQKTGERTFDFTKEGVAHYGLYADWLEDLAPRRRPAAGRRHVGGRRGVPADVGARERRSSPSAASSARTASSAAAAARCASATTGATVLSRAGQPQQRERAWSWCVKGKRNRTRGGRRGAQPGRHASTSSARPRTSATSSAWGSAARRRPSAARAASGGGLRVRRAGKRTFVWAVRKGRVRAVGVTTTRFAARRPALRARDAPRAAGPREQRAAHVRPRGGAGERRACSAATSRRPATARPTSGWRCTAASTCRPGQWSRALTAIRNAAMSPAITARPSAPGTLLPVSRAAPNP